ncbi:MAG: GDP-L-fucose synthase [bacterium]|nr:GDP-L-fucose synthase [bacterium]
MKNNFWQDKKIIVTGGGGFLGQCVVSELFRHGALQKDIFIPRSKEYDLREKAVAEEVVRGRDIIIHLAATAGGILFNKENPATIFYDNAAMALHLIDAAFKAGVKKFVGIGSGCEYPKFTAVPFQESDLWAGYPEETNAAYAFAKKFMLVESQAYREQYGFNAINLILANMYGPRDDFDLKSSHVIPALIQKIITAKESKDNFIEFWGTGKPQREFLYVDDAARAVVAAAEKYNEADPINIGSGKEISIKDLVLILCRLLNYHGEVHWDASKPDGQPRRLLDVTNAKDKLGFLAQTDLETGLRKTIDWYQTSKA